MAEQNQNNIPLGWQRAKVGSFLKLKNGYAFKSADYVDAGEDTVPVIRISDIKIDGANAEKAIHISTRKAVKEFEVEDGDQLIAMSGATTGKVGIYRGDSPAYQNQRVGNLKLISEENFNKQFKNYLIKEKSQAILDVAHGGAQPNVSARGVEELEVLVPPLPEQKRIVEKLDSLLAQVETIQQRLNNLPDIIKRFRQSVLAAAVSGKLTEQWRNKTSTELPKQSCLKELGHIVGGKTPSKSRNAFWESGTIPWVSPKDMKVYEIDESMDLITELAITEGGMKLVPKGSILMVTRSGILSHSFPVAVTTKDLTINQDIKAFIPDSRLITSHFAGVLMKGLSHRVLDECSKVGTTVSSVETSKLVNLKFDLPNLVEQVEIVRLVKQYFALADTLEKHLANAKARVDNLTQSILAKAFRGELVPQDPNDEPADKLLERVKAARLEAEKLEKAAKQAAKVKR